MSLPEVFNSINRSPIALIPTSFCGVLRGDIHASPLFAFRMDFSEASSSMTGESFSSE
jgi:hypothetical protein